MAEGVETLIALEVATGPGPCATGFVNAVGVAVTETDALVAGTFWRPLNRPPQQ